MGRAAPAGAVEAVEAGCLPQKRRILAFAEQVVAGEHLVGALARQHDLDAGLTDQPRQQEQRCRRRPQQRALGVEDDVGERVGDVLAADDDLVVVASDDARHH